jgi:hypothetical protein
MESITKEQTLILYMLPEKREKIGLMHMEGAYIAEAVKLMEYVES